MSIRKHEETDEWNKALIASLEKRLKEKDKKLI
jgi:hypothetical protein